MKVKHPDIRYLPGSLAGAWRAILLRAPRPSSGTLSGSLCATLGVFSASSSLPSHTSPRQQRLLAFFALLSHFSVSGRHSLAPPTPHTPLSSRGDGRWAEAAASGLSTGPVNSADSVHAGLRTGESESLLCFCFVLNSAVAGVCLCAGNVNLRCDFCNGIRAELSGDALLLEFGLEDFCVNCAESEFSRWMHVFLFVCLFCCCCCFLHAETYDKSYCRI